MGGIKTENHLTLLSLEGVPLARSTYHLSVVDPDSMGSLDPYPDPGGQKWPEKC